jgi:nicotinate-nucleotide adenylyltransferase
VLLMPAHTAPHKLPGEDPGPSHRLRMCALAAAGQQWLSACALEIERGGRSYTVDTLQALHDEHPNAQITFIVGADTASTLAGWREPLRLLELARLAVAARSGSARTQVLDAVSRLAGDQHAGLASAGEVSFLEMAQVEVSSSMVRERVARGEDIEELVGVGVASYIAANGLYRSPSAGGA